jgi:tetratricopeptide (TPR) repeat protein
MRRLIARSVLLGLLAGGTQAGAQTTPAGGESVPTRCSELSLEGDVRSVIASCQTAIQGGALQGQALAEALRHQGDAYFRAGRTADALWNYEEALTLRHDWALALWNKGNALHVLGDLERAWDAYTRAVEVEPGHSGAEAGLAGILWKSGDHDGALAQYTRALEFDPANHFARLNRIVLYRATQQPAAALKDCDLLLAANPEEVNATYMALPTDWRANVVSEVRLERAEALKMLGSIEESMNELEIVLRAEPSYVPAVLALTSLVVITETDNSKALPILDRALAGYPRSWELQIEKARVLALSGRGDEAAEILASSVRYEPLADPQFLLRRGEVRRLLSDHAAVTADFMQAMSLSRHVYEMKTAKMRELGYLLDSPDADPQIALADAMAACARDFTC